MGKSKDLASGAAYQDQTESDTRYVNTAGDTMTGTLNVNGGNFNLAPDNAAAHRYMFLNTGASQDGHILLQRALANKYQITAKTDNSYSIYSYPASGEVFNINSSGNVTTPNQPAFLAEATQAQTLGANWQDVGYNTLIGSQRGGTNYSTTTSKFTAPVSGWYQFNASWTATTNADTDGTFFLSINNSTSSSPGSVSIPTTSPHYDGHVISGCCYLAANDTMHVKRYSTVSTTTRTNRVYGGYFSGFLIG